MRVVVTERTGAETIVEAGLDDSVMEALRDGGVDDILAICGGSCSCATCHVYVDPDWLDKLEPMSTQEDELLETAEVRQANSRLSCQIRLTAELDGIKVTVPPED